CADEIEIRDHGKSTRIRLLIGNSTCDSKRPKMAILVSSEFILRSFQIDRLPQYESNKLRNAKTLVTLRI
ncbi:MAG: hypothetical protein L6406_23750, partial [Desulfobacterales bacterium]|nr:hypothetical protein [Desulfobacterales bacterium]